MPQSAEASAETNTAVQTTPPLPHRQEVFARHIVAGCSQAEAARRAGYAWDSARQTGSRLVADVNVAARIAELALAREDSHRTEHDDLVANLKRLMTDSMSKKNTSGALRAIDMLARFQGHYANGNRGQSGKASALSDTREAPPPEPAPQPVPIPDPIPAPEEPEPEAVFDPPMPPAPQPPVEPAPAPPPPPRMRPGHAIRVLQAKIGMIAHCRDTLKSRHPQVYQSLAFTEEAAMFFDDALDLLPQADWPTRQSPGKWLWSHGNPANPALSWVQDADARIDAYAAAYAAALVEAQDNDV
jgi:hypothetical protein